MQHYLFSFFCPYTVIKCSKKNEEKAGRVAVANGHIVEATMLKAKRLHDDERHYYYYRALYEYEWRGKTYRRRLTAPGDEYPDKKVYLYFVRNPRRATFKERLDMFDERVVYIYWAIVILLYLFK